MDYAISQNLPPNKSHIICWDKRSFKSLAYCIRLYECYLIFLLVLLVGCRYCNGSKQPIITRPLEYHCVDDFILGKGSSVGHAYVCLSQSAKSSKLEMVDPTISYLVLNRKKSTSPPQLWVVVYFTPQTMKRSILPSELCKTGQITLERFLGGCLLQ
jgi:hypothetical protein